MSDIMLHIGAQAVARSLEGFEGDLETRVRFAMGRAFTDDTWYTGDADEKLRAALGGVLLSLDKYSEDRATVERSVQALKALSAMLSGVPVDLERIPTDDILPLASMWREAVQADRDRWSRPARAGDSS